MFTLFLEQGSVTGAMLAKLKDWDVSSWTLRAQILTVYVRA